MDRGSTAARGLQHYRDAQQHKSTAEKRDSRVIIIHDGGMLVKEEGEMELNEYKEEIDRGKPVMTRSREESGVSERDVKRYQAWAKQKPKQKESSSKHPLSALSPGRG